MADGLALLESVRNYLDITWPDPALDQKLTEYITGGTHYLDDKAGAALDYLAPGPGRTLLLEYVRYARDGAMDVFENNYRHLLLAMQNNRKVSAYAADAISTGE